MLATSKICFLHLKNLRGYLRMKKYFVNFFIFKNNFRGCDHHIYVKIEIFVENHLSQSNFIVNMSQKFYFEYKWKITICLHIQFNIEIETIIFEALNFRYMTRDRSWVFKKCIITIGYFMTMIDPNNSKSFTWKYSNAYLLFYYLVFKQNLAWI